MLDTPEQALHDRRPVRGGGLVHRGGRGVQHVPIRHTERSAAAGTGPSVGGAGGSHGNAPAETARGPSKAGVIRRRGPRRGLGAAEAATLGWADRFNTGRPLEPIGNIPPAEAEARHHAQIEEPAPAA